MQKGRAGGLFLCMAMVFVIGLMGEVSAFEALDGKLRVNGFFKEEIGMRMKDRVWVDKFIRLGIEFGNEYQGGFVGLPDARALGKDPSYYENAKQEKYDLSTCRSNLQVTAAYDITPDLMAGVTFRAYYDAKYDLSSSHPYESPWASNMDAEDLSQYLGEDMESDVDLREYHLTWYVGDFKIKAGRQQIIWSEADAIRIADSINPIAMGRDFSTTAYALAWEDIRIPIRCIDITYTVPDSENQYEIEMVLNPEDYQVNTFAPYGETFYILPNAYDSSVMDFDLMMAEQGNLYSREGVFGGFGGVVPVMPNLYTKSIQEGLGDVIDKAQNDCDKNNTFQGAVRLRGVFGGWDIHPYYIYQRMQTPVFTGYSYFPFELYLPDALYHDGFMPDRDEIHRGLPMDGSQSDFGARVHFPRIHHIGATANFFHASSGTVLRIEGGYIPDHPFTGLRQGIVDPDDYNSAAPYNLGGTIYTGVDADALAYLDPLGIAWMRPGSNLHGADCEWEDWFDDEIQYRDVVQYMIGFDRPTWIPFLNPQATFFITGQFYHKIILDYDDDHTYKHVWDLNSKKKNDYVNLSTMLGKDQQSDHQYLASLKIDTHYMQDVIHPDVLVVWDFNAQAGFVRPAIKYQPNYQTRIEIGGLYVTTSGEGNYLAGPFGAIKDEDLVYITYEYKF